jgi:porin
MRLLHSHIIITRYHATYSMLALARSRLTRANRVFALALTVYAPVACAQSGAPEEGIPAQSIAANFPQTVDEDRRKALALKGVTYGLNYVGLWLSDVSGGVSRGSGYIGRLEGIVDVDFAKVAGWVGLTFHANVYQIHGTRFSRDHLQTLMPAGYIEALATTRLSELWIEQKLLGEKLSVRLGQLTSDSEFITSKYATQFINNTFGWPAGLAANLPSTGPAYPFATPGVRVKLDPNKHVSLLFGLFNGDPAGPGAGDPEERDLYGTSFRIHDPALVMGEIQYRYNQDKGPGLAGTIKLGAWAHFGRFNDLRFDTDGRSLADPAANGDPKRLRGDHGVYAVVDQQIWRPVTGEPNKGVGVFVRLTASPADRNLVDAYIDGGIVFAGLVPWRPDDVLSFGAAYAHISHEARAPDAEAVAFNGAGVIRDFEAMFEVNYQAQILPGLQIDLDVQRFVHPGGDIAGPNGSAITDATVVILHTSIKY